MVGTEKKGRSRGPELETEMKQIEETKGTKEQDGRDGGGCLGRRLFSYLSYPLLVYRVESGEGCCDLCEGFT